MEPAELTAVNFPSVPKTKLEVRSDPVSGDPAQFVETTVVRACVRT